MMALDMILQHCQADAEKTAFTFCSDNFVAHTAVTYAVLGETTAQLARSMLRARGGDGKPLLQSGDRVLLVFIPSLEFILTFIACLRAGLVAVPVYPPDPRNLRVNTTLFSSICKSSGATVALSHAAYTQAISLARLRESAMQFLSRSKDSAAWPDLIWLRIAGERVEGAAETDADLEPLLDSSRPTDLAFLQYTSGSTSEPKGVRLTHACLAHNVRSIVSSLSASRDTVVVSWLPQYHDMGLIGSYLACAACGGTGFYASPLTFIKRPLGWLHAITRYKGTHVQAPNFAYALCARKFRESRLEGVTDPSSPEHIDLSSLRHCFNAAEPVTAAAIRDFCESFCPLGFNPRSMAPGYGLAEHTVFVCVGGDHAVVADRKSLEEHNEVHVIATYPLQQLTSICKADLIPDRENAVLVSCGPAWPYSSIDEETERPPSPIHVAIAEPESCRLINREGAIGEVWLSSQSVADGYFQAPDLSAAAFGATLQLPADAAIADGDQVQRKSPSLWMQDGGLPRTWLRTGDLGFIHRGQLFIAGRLKDMLILRGRNFYPADVETIVEMADPKRIRPGCTAAFATDSEGVVVAVEVRGEVSVHELPQLASDIRSSVATDFGLRLEAVLLLKPRGVQKTTSGKVARRWNAKAWATLQSSQTSPWSVGKGLVLLIDKAPASDWEEGGVAISGDEGAAGTPLGQLERPEQGNAQAGGAVASTTGVHLSGKDLLLALRRDVAVAVGLEPRAVDITVGLVHLGLDSLALMQLQGRMATKYGLHVRDDLMFSEDTSLTWLVTQTEELRKPLELQQGLPTVQGGDADMDRQAPQVAIVAQSAPTDVVGSPKTEAMAPLPIVQRVPLATFDLSDIDGIGGPDGGTRRRRRGPSSFEQNCPCMLWCMGK